MRPGNRDVVPTVEEAVSAGAQACDPDRRSDAVTAFVEGFEGDVRPATAAEDLGDELRSAVRVIDPEIGAPEVWAAAAAAHWLATNPGAAGDPERAIREGARLLFGGDPPLEVADWLRSRGAV